jgi:hypothetical protein
VDINNDIDNDSDIDMELEIVKTRVAEPENLKTVLVPLPTSYLITVPVPAISI